MGYRAAYFGPDGKRRYVSGKSRAAAEKALRKAMNDAEGGLVAEAGNLTLAAFLARWLNDSVKGNVAPTTHDSYSRLVRAHVVPKLGRVKLRGLTAAHLARFYRTKLDDGLSPRTVQYLHVVIHRALKQATRWGLVTGNVGELVDPPRVIREEMRPLTREETTRLFDAASGDRLEALVVFSTLSGLRQGEALALRWVDVDLEAGLVRVRRTLRGIRDGAPLFGSPKTGRSSRTVKLPPKAVAALRAHLDIQMGEIEKAGDLYRDNGLVFATATGTPLSRQNVGQRYFKALLRRAELPERIRWHDLRHTCATLLLSKNVNPKVVSEMLGHSSVSITLDTYSHVLPDMQDSAAAALEDTFS